MAQRKAKQIYTRKPLKSGEYAMQITSIKPSKIPNIYIMQMTISPVIKTIAKDLEKIDPTELKTFFIMNSKLNIYTSIGAKNVYHASNKATQMFGSRWSSLCQYNAGVPRHYQHQTVADFGELIRTLPN